MRPRRIRRGEPSPVVVSTTGVVKLQCGHGEFAVENRHRARPQHHGLPASMRPRRIRRGELDFVHGAMPFLVSFNAATANSPWRTWLSQRPRRGLLLASMRPRRIRRGEPVAALHRLRAIHQASMRPRRIRRGELPICWRACRSKPSFNAATANSPWRTSMGTSLN